MSHVIGDPRKAGEAGPAGDTRKAGEEGPAGDTRAAGQATTNTAKGSDTKGTAPTSKRATKSRD